MEGLATLGPFRLLRPLGRGGMGAVWTARHLGPGSEEVAVKIIDHALAREPEWGQAFRREVQAVAALDHPHVVAVHDYGQVTDEEATASRIELAPGAPYLVMEQIPGRSARELRGQVDWPELRVVLVSLLEALAHAHARGVIHRDLKPGNLLQRSPGGPVCLVDFGLAHALDRLGDGFARGTVQGTPSYMAPEQVEGRWREFGPWTDLYAVGCLGWALACGRAPFAHVGGATERMVAQVVEQPPAFAPLCPLPDGFDAWLATLLHKEPRLRFRRAADAASALLSLDPGATSPIRPVRRTRHLTGSGLGLFGLKAVPFVGRDWERRTLDRALESVHRERRPRLVVLRGPAGTGKTRLALHVARGAEERGQATLLRATHGPPPTSGAGIVPMLTRHLRAVMLRRGALDEHLRRTLPGPTVEPDELESLVELLAPAGPGEEPTVRFASPAERHAVVARLLARLTADRPAVLLLDDVQWGLDALGLVEHLLGRPAAPPVLVIATVRDEALADRPLEAEQLAALEATPGASTLKLGPLSAAERADLVRGLLGLEGRLAARLEERCGGNPLFAVQAVGDWVHRRLLVPGGAGFRLAEGARVQLPDSLHAVWSARLEAASPGGGRSGEGRELAAALGEQVSWSEWAAGCARVGLTAEPELVDRLASRGLARWLDAGRGWAFAHGMLRQCLQRRARESGRWERLNLACAEALGPDATADRIGQHLLEGGRPRQALAPLLEGAEALRESGDHGRALDLLERREQAVERSDIEPDGPERMEGLLARATTQRLRGELDEAGRLAAEVTRRARASGRETLIARALLEAGHGAAVRGELPEALSRLQEAERLADQLGDGPLAARCASARGLALSTSGRLDEAERALQRGLAAWQPGDPPRVAASALLGLARVATQRGDPDAAQAFAGRGRSLARSHGMRYVEALFANELGETARARGDLDAAVEAYAAAARGFEAAGSAGGLVPACNLVIVQVMRRRWRRARREIEDLLPRLRDRTTLLAVAHVASLPCAAAEGDWRGFDRTWDEAVRALELSGLVDIDLVRLLGLAAGLADAAGKPERAARVRGLERDQATRLGLTGPPSATG